MTIHALLILRIIGLLILLMAAGRLLANETAVIFRPGEEEPGFAERIAVLSRLPFLSAYAQGALLTDCHQALNSTRNLVRPRNETAGLTSACETVAERAIGSLPTHSFAWLVAAEARAATGNIAGVNAALALSRNTGPNEGWIADFRVALAETYLDRLDAGNRAGHDRDIKLLVASTDRIRLVGQRYMRDPDFRKRVTDIVATMPADHQRRFLTVIRNQQEVPIQP